MYYEKTLCDSSSEWIVLLHGLGGTLLSLKYQIREYSKYYNIIAIELPGHGHSVSEPPPKVYDLENVAAKVVEVMDECGVERAHFMAVSIGTMIAVGVAAFHPQRVISMVQGAGILRFEWQMRLFAHPAVWSSKIFSHYTVYNFFASFIFPGKKHAFARRIFIKGAAQMGCEAFCAWVLFMFGRGRRLRDFICRLNSLEKPIPQIYIMGEDDFLFRRSTPRLAGRIKGTETVVIEDAGHICNIERRKEFNRISLEFFQKNREQETV